MAAQSFPQALDNHMNNQSSIEGSLGLGLFLGPGLVPDL